MENALITNTSNYPNNIQNFQGRTSSAIKPEILRVAAYCRVSTLTDMQEDSLENQIKYYTSYIRSKSNWHFVDIYSDQGKSGTKIDSRSGFQKLIRHVLEGKIDLILCKSISRFARNVIDTIDTVRLLKEHGVRVIFDKEKIDTSTMQSEFIITLLGAIAQEESRNISENIRWANEKRFRRGEPIFIRVLGYKKGDNKEWVIAKEEAEIVKEVFDLCLKGVNSLQIARMFINKGYKKTNGRTDWDSTAIRYILRNERYTGDVLCQKSYTKDHLTHTSKRNDGAVSQYLIKNHHEAIVDKDTFIKAQEMLVINYKPGRMGEKNSYPLSGRIMCGECGTNLHRFNCRGLVSWRCGSNTKSNELCSNKAIKEEEIKKIMKRSFKMHYKIYKLEKVAIQNMISDLKNAKVICDIEYNKLRLELERALFEENIAVLKGDALAENIKLKREAIEKEFDTKKIWWDMIESDNQYRVKALDKLELISRIEMPSKALDEYLNGEDCIEFLRAWVVRVKALSPIKISIEWIYNYKGDGSIGRKYE